VKNRALYLSTKQRRVISPPQSGRGTQQTTTSIASGRDYTPFGRKSGGEQVHGTKLHEKKKAVKKQCYPVNQSRSGMQRPPNLGKRCGGKGKQAKRGGPAGHVTQTVTRGITFLKPSTPSIGLIEKRLYGRRVALTQVLRDGGS